ncbi:sugar transferase [Pseudohalocynthiibacter sp. F2068]|uniref:sugar transferase n=1 Tax=Pseudohalocynthiibacter sp. F2068 TaxID=2926418 RepID=UPI0032B2E2DE
MLASACLSFFTATLASFQEGSLFFGQDRVGKNGKLFRIWKFRTMHMNADEALIDLLSKNPVAAHEWTTKRKLQSDPRVTRLGGFLRRTSLDELPQLWTVFCGEMSLVGPRPVPGDELRAEYRGDAWAYLSCKPGLTGLWQVSGRNMLDYTQRVQLGVAYSRRQNLSLDLLILWRTIAVVLRCTGR